MIGLILTVAGVLATAGRSEAQFSLTIGNPGYGYGNGYGYGYSTGLGGFSGPIAPGYVGGYNSYSSSAYLAGPGSFSYSSGYRGYAPAAIGYGAPAAIGYGAPAAVYPYAYPYRSYPGYRGYGYNRNSGFRPFRGVFSWLR